MPRTKEEDAARKRLAYANNDDYRQKHKEKMRLRYHEKKQQLAELQENPALSAGL